jgi:hypothetical protein
MGRFVNGLASKPLGRFSLVSPQNRWLRVSRFGPQNRQIRFGDLCLKITTVVSWFEPQKQVDKGVSVAPQNCLASLRRKSGYGFSV